MSLQMHRHALLAELEEFLYTGVPEEGWASEVRAFDVLAHCAEMAIANSRHRLMRSVLFRMRLEAANWMDSHDPDGHVPHPRQLLERYLEEHR